MSNLTAPSSEQWFALQVRTNHERIVQTALQAKRYAEFLPSYRKKVRWSDRLKSVEYPLFPGYIFSRFDVGRRLPILTIPGVVSVLGIAGHPEPVDEGELEAIRRFVASGLPLTPWPYLKVGERVIVEEGSLAGLDGILVQTKSQYRVVVSLSLLQRSVAVELDREWIRPRPVQSARPKAMHACAGA